MEGRKQAVRAWASSNSQKGLGVSTSIRPNRKDHLMGKRCPGLLFLTGALAIIGLWRAGVKAACCYFAAKDKDVLQPAQKAFLTWDPAEKVETFTVQPRFEGNALDFGMVIPTPARPKLHEMPRDFFKELAVFTILKKREYPQSKLLPVVVEKAAIFTGISGVPTNVPRVPTTVKVLEA